jgi:excisionase family DNA binding protein
LKEKHSTVADPEKATRLRRALTWETAPDILTIDEAASLLRIPRNAAYEAARAGLLPAANFGQRRIRVSKALLKQVFESGPEHETRTAAFSHLPGGEK